MGIPRSDDLAVRVTVVGHASPRWRAAQSLKEADLLNQRLSEARARNVKQMVEHIIKVQLPNVPIDVPAKGVGSHERFPTASEDNAAVDRGVLLMVDLVTSRTVDQVIPKPPRHVYAPSKFWVLKVVKMDRVSIGASDVDLAVVITNVFTKKEIVMEGNLKGGDLDITLGKKGPSSKPSWDPTLPGHFDEPIGNVVTFITSEAMDYDDWVNADKSVRLVHGKIGAIRKRETTFLQFRNLDTFPDSLVFEYSKGWSLPSVDISVVTGTMKVVSKNEGDFMEVPSPPERIPTKLWGHRISDGILLCFPTGKADLGDLTDDDRRNLTKFVEERALVIKALLESYNFSSSSP